MWEYINNKFERFPSQQRVVKKMISLGLSVRKDNEGEGHIFCESIEIKPNSLATALGVDRRVVVEVLAKILADSKLYSFFTDLRPVAHLGAVSSKMGMGVIQIVPELASQPGIIAGVSNIISRANISIRQVIVDDPELVEDPRATIVTDSPIPSDLLPDLKKVRGVGAVVIL